MSLKTRLIAVATLIVILASLAAWTLFQRLAENIIEQWGQHLVETQVRYDRARLLQALEREIALARQLADSASLKRWAARPEDSALASLVFEELETYRQNFRDQSYFVALLDSGAYYHNNASNEFQGQELRYHLNPDKPADAWFYRLVQAGKDFHLNVNPDSELGVTKVWIDMLIRDEQARILGVAGTGLELEDFLGHIVDLDQPGVTTLFLDQDGAIQLHRDPALIDFASIVKPEGQKNTFDRLLTLPDERQRFVDMMHSLRLAEAPAEEVLKTFVTIRDKRYLAGLTYMPTLGWFEVTLLDLTELVPLSSFMPVVVVFLLTLVITLLLSHLTVRHLLLDPLVALEKAMMNMRDGKLDELSLPRGQGEVGRLIQHFATMAAAIRDNTRQLESKVHQRTAALEHLTRTDPLTDLLNRRGMTERLEQALARTQRDGSQLALLWLDVDHFKSINDTHGHARGDQALQAVAEILRACLRRYDQASRWGGDEFLVLLTHCDEASMLQIGERIRSMVEASAETLGAGLTVSMGAHLARPGESLDSILQHADSALYAAKSAGRNRLCRYADAGARSQTSQA